MMRLKKFIVKDSLTTTSYIKTENKTPLLKFKSGVLFSANTDKSFSQQDYTFALVLILKIKNNERICRN